ncbi:MAG: adenylyltransferase/cytidyltransferase family protein [Planctomycetota bacterium]
MGEGAESMGDGRITSGAGDRMMELRPTRPAAKILTSFGLQRLREEAREAGQRVVHCHGCFDIVHPGHIRHLRHARTLGDVLLVSITGDEQISKGAGRPLIPEGLRAENLAELDCVDWVYVERRPTAAELLTEVGPDVYVKGKEYERSDDPRFLAERAAVERAGGRVVFSSGDVVFSSSALIRAIERDASGGGAEVGSDTGLQRLLARDELSSDRLIDRVRAMRGRRMVIIGEAMRETDVFCDRPTVDADSPVLGLRPIEQRSVDAGAAMAAMHAAALGAETVLVTALPGGAEGEGLQRRLEAAGVEVRAIEADVLPERRRFLVGPQPVMTLEPAENAGLDAGRQDALVRTAAEVMAGGADAAVLVDEGLGLLSAGVIAGVRGVVRSGAARLIARIGGSATAAAELRRADVLIASEAKMRELAGVPSDGLPVAAWRVLTTTRSVAAVVTLGSEGLVAFEPLALTVEAEAADPHRSRVIGEPVPVLGPMAVDSRGSETALAVIAGAAMGAGAGLVEASFLGAAASAVQGQRLGQQVVSGDDIRRAVQRLHAANLTLERTPTGSPASTGAA